MARFLGAAREQVERILAYAAAGGSAALVSVSRERIELRVGPTSPHVPVRAWIHVAQRGHQKPESGSAWVSAPVEGFLVGRVGDAHALVARPDERQRAAPAVIERFEKACWMLNRMLRPRVEEPMPPPARGGSGSSGSPAELRLWPPHTRARGRA